jgi:hypothetical protein
MLMGFVVGIVICYQILYTEIADHLPQFATLRAIGFLARLPDGRGAVRGGAAGAGSPSCRAC